MRPVKNRHTAIERLAPLLPNITLKKLSGGRYRIRINGARLAPAEKDSKHTLAFLAEEAKYALDQDAVLEEVNWVGRIPSRGLAAWQEDALLWLQGSNIFGVE